MADIAVALAIHVAAIVVWIGGVAMVTTVLLPAVRQAERPEDRLAAFERIERRFARQARISTLIAAASGFYMADRMDMWSRFATGEGWWLDAMVFVWAVFTFMLFVAEPFFLDRWLEGRAAVDPEGTFRLVQRLHYFLLAISLVAVLGATAGVNGLSFGD